MSLCRVHRVARIDRQHTVQGRSQDLFRLQVIIGGVACMRIGDEEWMVRSQQIYLIPPKMEHILEDTSGGMVPLKHYDVSFSVSDRGLFRALTALPRPLHHEHHQRFVDYLELLLQESYAKRPFAREAISERFSLMMIDLVRRFGGQEEASSLPVIKGSSHYFVKGINMPELLGYIQSNLGQPITLDGLCRMAGINKTTLTEVFKNCFGVTPVRYVNQERLAYAKELLINTDLSVGEIAESVGFSNHNFSRYFRAQHGCTPLEYRTGHEEDTKK